MRDGTSLAAGELDRESGDNETIGLRRQRRNMQAA